MVQGRIEFPGERRVFATVTHLPLLARLRIGPPDTGPEGRNPLVRRLAAWADEAIEFLAGQKFHGSIELRLRDGTTAGAAFDTREDVFLDFADAERRGGFAPAESALLERLLPRTGTFWDVCAGWGYFSWLAATHPTFAGAAVCFENAPALLADIERIRIAVGRPAAVRVERFALSDVTTRGTGAKSDPRALARIDDLRLAAPDLIRLDARADLRGAVEGGASTIRRHRPALLYPYRDPFSDDVELVADLLAENEYRFHAVTLSEGTLTLDPVTPGRPEHMPPSALLFAAPPSRIASLIG
jgi:hypothetical protein